MIKRMGENETDREATLSVERDSTSTVAAPPVQAWEEIEPGRYMPRRTRGSFPGRELG